MLERIICPFHIEATGSCVVYDTHYHCYGCGKAGPLSDIGRTESPVPIERFQEDLEQTRKYIDGLPKKTIRGFDFNYDAIGYYIIWPNCLYYKRRNWEDRASKYKNPSGHSQPMFVARELPVSERLFIVEGEINALSVARSFPADDVISPGSATDFKTKRTLRTLTYTVSYSTIVLIVDRDGPGTEAAIHTKGLLLGKVPEIKIVLMPQDANKVLCDSGPEALKEEIEGRLYSAL